MTPGFGFGSIAWPYTKTSLSKLLTALLLLMVVFAGYPWRRDGGRWLSSITGFALDLRAPARGPRRRQCQA